jgi:hypothetical protein
MVEARLASVLEQVVLFSDIALKFGNLLSESTVLHLDVALYVGAVRRMGRFDSRKTEVAVVLGVIGEGA